MVRDDAEELRRRLYAPGAAGDDVDRYRDAGGGAAVPAAAVPAATAPRRSPPRLRLIVVVALVVLVVAGIGIARLAGSAHPSGPSPTPLAVTDEDRAAFEQNLALGNEAGIAAWLLTTTPLPRFERATRFWTDEDRGVGDDVVTLSPVPAVAVSGRATVFLVLDRSAQAGWTTLRRSVDPSGEELYVRQVHRSGGQAAGDLTVQTYRYAAGDRPVQVRVDAPDGVQWGLAVVFTD